MENFGICKVQCGGCCGNRLLCDNCSLATLRANGISVKHITDIKSLSCVWNGNGGFKYSDLYKKLEELSSDLK